ncbi:MAG: hypothetical protein HN916_13750 [Anaerolineae bacterium]|nr:hypothetical protein [Anaerolineae bacterium]
MGNIISQWASNASASSEYGNPDWAAQQATGAPDTLECGDTPTAWASEGNFTTEWLELRYDTPVTPTEINIYESHTPTQVVRVEIFDTQGSYHEVYSAQPKMTDCPYILSISVQEADYQATGVKITIDQSQLNLPWNEIDAVELVGYGDASPALAQDEELEEVPDSPPVDAPDFELPIANPEQDPSFSISYSGCNEEGREEGIDVEVSVHDDRIDIRLRGIHKKYALLTLPRNLEDNYRGDLTPFKLEGRVPPSAGLYIRSVWWYGEKGTMLTHYNADDTLSGSVDFEGTRKSGCAFNMHTEFEHIVLRE